MLTDGIGRLLMKVTVRFLYLKFKSKTIKKTIDPVRTRTWNPLIRSQMPYPLGHGAFLEGAK